MNEMTNELGEPPGELREGTVCASHPNRKALWICERCGNFICEKCQVVTPVGKSLCLECYFLSARNQKRPIPWEDPNASGRVISWIRTVWMIWYNPTSFFQQMLPCGSYLKPLLFGVICYMFLIMPLWIVMGMFLDVLPAGWNRTALPVSLSVFFFPAVTLIILFVVSFIFHLFIKLMRVDRSGFEGTFRVVSYASAVNVVLLLPYCGELIALPYSCYVLITGLREVHRMKNIQAAIVVCLPLVFLVIMSGILIMAVLRYDL